MALNAPDTSPADESGPREAPLVGCLVRVAWMAAGNAALLMLAFTIAREPSFTLTAKDALFWAIVAAVIGLRCLDVTRLHGRTADGEPARLRHVARHAVGLIVLAGLLWTIVQSVQFAA